MSTAAGCGPDSVSQDMLAQEELHAWLRLSLTRGVGLRSAQRLLAAFGSAPGIFHQSLHTLQTQVSAAQAAALMVEPHGLVTALEAVQSWLIADGRHAVWPLGHPDYPAALYETADPPLLLYAHGRRELLQRPMVAIVGSRQATPQGLENAYAFSRDLSQAGVTIVSGLAAGIDGAAHEGGLAGVGSTIAVMGTGVDKIYPRRHQALAARVASEGLLLTEYPLGTGPVSANFPKRNRIIAGLSRGTLVVEAALRSGSLITARLAVDLGREVFSIPGSIHSPQAQGCNWLIQEGACLVQSAADILEALHLSPTLKKKATETHLAAPEDPLMRALGYDPVDLDTLAMRTGLGSAALQAQLLTLELENKVARLPGGRFQRQSRA